MGSRPGAFVLHVGVAAEVLPLLVLDPTRHHRFIWLVKRVLEIMQVYHQEIGFRRCAVARAVGIDERNLQARPVDLLGQQDQFVAGVQKLVEVGLKQFKSITSLGIGLPTASMPGLSLQGFEPSAMTSWQSIPSKKRCFALKSKRMMCLSGATTYRHAAPGRARIRSISGLTVRPAADSDSRFTSAT